MPLQGRNGGCFGGWGRTTGPGVHPRHKFRDMGGSCATYQESWLEGVLHVPADPLGKCGTPDRPAKGDYGGGRELRILTYRPESSKADGRGVHARLCHTWLEGPVPIGGRPRRRMVPCGGAGN